jgi:hypothetical protein
VGIILNGVAQDDWLILDAPILDPAKPKTQWAYIPDGIDIDVTGVLSAGWPGFERTFVSIPVMLTSGESLWDARSRLVRAYQGKSVKLSFTDRPAFYLEGRLTLVLWRAPGNANTVMFVAELDALPIWWAVDGFNVSIGANPTGVTFSIPATGFPVIPQLIVVGGDVTITTPDGTVISLSPGKYDYISKLIIWPNAPITLILKGENGSQINVSYRGGYLA